MSSSESLSSTGLSKGGFHPLLQRTLDEALSKIPNRDGVDGNDLLITTPEGAIYSRQFNAARVIQDILDRAESLGTPFSLQNVAQFAHKMRAESISEE